MLYSLNRASIVLCRPC